MNLEVNGVEYTKFIRLNATIRLDALCNSFVFEAAHTGGVNFPVSKGDSCRVLVEDEPVLTGWVEMIHGGYDSSTHTITLQGRDKTGDLVDSQIDVLGDIRGPVSLKFVIEKVISSIGLNIKVIDNAKPAPYTEAEDIASIEPGENAFTFIENLARHRQVLLTSNGNGDIVIEKISKINSGGFLQNLLNQKGNNILSANFNFDDTERFNVYKFVSSLNPVTLNKTSGTKIGTLVHQQGAIIDTGIRKGRQFVSISEGLFSDESNQKRAVWEANIRKARGRSYSCTVQGYRPNNDPTLPIWTPNRLVTIVDDFAGIDTVMLINSVDFSLNLESGRTTTLSLVDQNSYTLELSDPSIQKLGGLF